MHIICSCMTIRHERIYSSIISCAEQYIFHETLRERKYKGYKKTLECIRYIFSRVKCEISLTLHRLLLFSRYRVFSVFLQFQQGPITFLILEIRKGTKGKVLDIFRRNSQYFLLGTVFQLYFIYIF